MISDLLNKQLLHDYGIGFAFSSDYIVVFTKFGCHFLRILVFVILCTAVRHLLDTVFTLKQDASIFVVFFTPFVCKSDYSHRPYSK